MEVQEMRNYNTKLKSDNEYLQARLSSCELEIEYLNDPRKEREAKNFELSKKLLSNMPQIEQSKYRNAQYPTFESKTNVYTVLD